MDAVKVPKKVNRHILKALDFLQKSRTDFVSIEAIQTRVRWSLRYTNPVENLEELVNTSLRNQTELGFIKRSGASSYAMTITLHGPRSSKNITPIKKNEAGLCSFKNGQSNPIQKNKTAPRSFGNGNPIEKMKAERRSCKDAHSNPIKKIKAGRRCIDSLNVDEIFEVRQILHKDKKPLDKKKPIAIRPKLKRQRKLGKAAKAPINDKCTMCGSDMETC